MELNTYKNIKSSNVINTVPHIQILDEIRTGKNHGGLVTKARKYGKGHPQFDKIKVQQLPTFTSNATFDGVRRLDRVESETGLIYLDVDACLEVDFGNPLIHASWLSVSGTGRGIWVQVIGLTSSNISNVYKSISNELNLVTDLSCTDITRQTVLSHDPKLYHNPDSEVYCAIDISGEDKKKVNKGTLLNKTKDSSAPLITISETESQQLIYNNYSTLKIPEGYKIYEDKTIASKLYFPRQIKTGNRHKSIKACLHQMIALNSNIMPVEVDKYLRILNSRCIKPLNSQELKIIGLKLLEEREQGLIEPLLNLPRSILFDKDYPKEDKPKICGEVSGMIRRNNSINKINEVLNSWDCNDGKVKCYKVAELACLSRKTVEKHIREVEDLKKLKNYINSQI